MGPIGKDNLTPFALRMLLSYYQSADTISLQMASITGNTDSAVLTFFGDFGLIGFLLFLTLYIIAFAKAVHVTRDLKASLQKKVIAESLIGILVMLVLVSVVKDVFYSAFTTMWIWSMVAFLYLPDEQIDDCNLEDKKNMDEKVHPDPHVLKVNTPMKRES